MFEPLPNFDLPYETIDTNAIFIIQPYKVKTRLFKGAKKQSLWVFDDEERGLKREPFVAGMSQMIDRFVEEQGLDPRWLTLFFSLNPPPVVDYYHLKMMRLEKKSIGGAWYREVKTRMGGWLCPAMLKYFGTYPWQLYIWSE